MTEQRRRRSTRREEAQATPTEQENGSAASARRRRSARTTPPEERSWNSDSVWDDTPPEQTAGERFVPEEDRREILATNRAIRLTCTLAGMSALFALFLCFAERESRAIRHCAVSSVALRAADLALGAVLYLIGVLFSGIPLMGFVIQLVCWLFYLGVTMLLVVIRVRMMLFSWNGLRYDLPVIGTWLEKRFG